jgi:hypothetical protein
MEGRVMSASFETERVSKAWADDRRKDQAVLDAMTTLISENEWDSDMFEPIVDLLRSTGRVIRND